MPPPQTNIVVASGAFAAAELCRRLAQHDVLALPFGDNRIRLVLYGDIDDLAVDRAVAAVAASLP